MKNIFALLLPLLLLYAGCKKPELCQDIENPACENYDPCYSAFETNAAFSVTNWTNPYYLPFRDTIPIGGDLRIFFRASDTRMSRYEWQIGQDPRVFTDSLFSLVFNGVSGWVNFSLTTYHDKADANCFPGDNGKVTVQKAYYFKPFTATTDEAYIAQFPIFGTYLGHDEGSPLDTFQVRIDWPPHSRVGINNMPEGCDSRSLNAKFNTHYFIDEEPLFPGPNQALCYSPNKILATLQPDNRTLHIDYEITQNGQRIKRKWVGVKL